MQNGDLTMEACRLTMESNGRGLRQPWKMMLLRSQMGHGENGASAVDLQGGRWKPTTRYMWEPHVTPFLEYHSNGEIG